MKKHKCHRRNKNLLEHRPLKVGHPCLLPLQQTWKKSFQRPKCPLRWNDLAPTLKFQVRLRFVQENHLKGTDENENPSGKFFGNNSSPPLLCKLVLIHSGDITSWIQNNISSNGQPRNWHPPLLDGRSRRGTRWRFQSWCSHKPPQIDAGLVPDKILSKLLDFSSSNWKGKGRDYFVTL